MFKKPYLLEVKKVSEIIIKKHILFQKWGVDGKTCLI